MRAELLGMLELNDRLHDEAIPDPTQRGDQPVTDDPYDFARPENAAFAYLVVKSDGGLFDV